MKKIFITLLFVTCIIFSCKKEADKKYCWQGFISGGDIPGLVVCGKTASEVQAQYPQYWFYKTSEPKYCWQMKDSQGKIYYVKNIPVSMTDKLKIYGGYSFTKIDCSSFCHWRYYDKTKSKATGLFGQTKASAETYWADSCVKLFVGRKIIMQETPDSIYIREFVEQE